MSRTSPASSCSGLRTGIAAIVVQFGLAMMPRPAAITPSIASGLTSETTSGIAGSLRKALELSTTMTPASTNFGTSAREVEPARVGGLGVLDDDALETTGPREGQHRARGPGRGEEADLLDRELPLLEDLAHGDADLTGRADHAEPDGPHRPVPP